jgi:hypothetical protein
VAQLTDQERQEVMCFPEAGKPLPDKYRFQPFEDTRKVELFWNGKTSEVCVRGIVEPGRLGAPRQHPAELADRA